MVASTECEQTGANHSETFDSSRLRWIGDMRHSLGCVRAWQTFGELEAKKGAPVQPWRFWNLLKTAFPQVTTHARRCRQPVSVASRGAIRCTAAPV